MTEEQKPNTFAQMEAEGKPVEQPTQSTQPTQPEQQTQPAQQAQQTEQREISTEDLSDTAVGDRVRYVRPDLNGQEDVVESYKIFPADTTQPPTKSTKGTSEYWKIPMLLTYESKNADGVNNKEYISGARVFKQKDGSVSAPSFWYKGHKTQSGLLWETVAAAMLKEPSDLSPREFSAFLNTKPKVMIVAREYDNFNAGVNAPKTIMKNLPGSFI